MFIPIRTDRRLKHTPWVNYALIAANTIIFLLTKRQIELQDHIQNLMAHGQRVPHHLLSEFQHGFPVANYFLQPLHPHVYQFITYQFLHASWMHLIGNMIFLYVFGNSVEDRLGKVGYLLFYLAGGVIAGLGHSLMTSSPVLGASGSIAAVTGAYLALFPLSNVTIVYFFILIGAFEISSLLLILFQVAENLVFHFFGTAHVAYLAHLAGYAFGFAVGMGLLLARILPREAYDMLALIERYHRRSSFRRMAKRGYHPWQHPGSDGGLNTAPAAPPTPQEQRIMEQRARIQQAVNNHDMPTAAGLYRDLLRDEPGQVMSQQLQLDLANQLMSESRYDAAASAYELFLSHYGSYPEREHVELILGLIYARYLDQPNRAGELLNNALPRLSGSDRDLAQQALSEVT